MDRFRLAAVLAEAGDPTDEVALERADRVLALVTESAFDPGDGWVEWLENSTPLRRERVIHVVPHADTSFEQRIWIRSDE